MRKTMAMALVAATTVLGACDDSGVDVDATVAEVAGTYEADAATGILTVTVEEDGSSETTDWLDGEGLVTLELNEDGTTAGRLFLPGGGEDGEDFDMDLAGTWSLDDGVVTLDHEADTFLRDMDLEYDDGVLRGEETFSDATVRIEIRRP